MLGALTENRPHRAAKYHHVRVTHIPLPIPFLDLSSIVVHSFPELDSDTCDDREHFTAVLNHETLSIKDLELALEETLKPYVGNP